MRTDAHLRQLTDALKATLTRCADDPDVEAVHDTRTGTRRIEAALEAAVRNAGVQVGEAEDLRADATRRWERLLKRVRRAAAPVRDLDVQRKLLKKLAPEGDGTQADASLVELAEQIGKLDAALGAEREERTAPLKRNAAKWAEKMDGHYAVFAGVMAQGRTRRTRKADAARVALDAFARLATRLQQLDAGNLHDFRKGAKKARYMAEAGVGNERAGAIGKALKKLQDEIGDWHDWVMLTEEAHKYLGTAGGRLTAEIERRRDEQFAAAMKQTTRMRGQLMGEWLGTRRPGRGFA
jgi:CHAD domain-containing protein